MEHVVPTLAFAPMPRRVAGLMSAFPTVTRKLLVANTRTPTMQRAL